MKKFILTILVVLSLGISFDGHSTTINIPAQYSTVQQGIDASVDGDTVLVAPGTYFENLNLYDKNIVLCSWYLTTGDTAHISATIIDGSNYDRVITISQGQSPSCQIAGFTIENGYTYQVSGETYGGGGILILDASPLIRHCVIQYNYAEAYGGGLCIYGSTSSAKVTNCTIRNNNAESFGGGVFMGDCAVDAEIANCIISGNTITCTCDWNGGGGGVNLYHKGRLTNCLITGNSALNSSVGGGGIHCDWGNLSGSQGIFVTGCTITNNTALNNGGVSYVIAGGEFRNCILWGNTDYFNNTANYDGNTFVNSCTDPLPAGTGNINSDPGFVDGMAGNFRLAAGSPCIEAGNNSFNNQTLDLDGNPRIKNTIDMGAYEYGSIAGTTIQIGSGNDTSQYFPIHTFYGYNYSQQIYLGSEIAAAGGTTGPVTKIRFFYSSSPPDFSTWNIWTVYMGNTTKTEFTSSLDWVPVAGMTEVFSDTLPDPVAGTWIEITLTTPFYYTGENIVVAVDENSDNWNDPPAYWGTFNSGAPRGLLYYDDSVNPDPASPPEANYGTDYNIARVQFDMSNVYGTLEGYVYEEPGCTAPVVGATVTSGPNSATTNASGFYQLILAAGIYYDITAHYFDVSQTVSPITITGGTTTQDFCVPHYYAPPVNLQATVSGSVFNDVHLSWMPPGSIADQWIHWDNGSIIGSLGYGAPTTFSVASRWPVSDIAPFNGTYLKKIRFVPMDATSSYTLKVWKGADATTLLYSQLVVNPYIGIWNDITLTTPVLIDGTEEFWFGVEIIQTIGYPAGLSSGPAVVGKGDMFNDGNGWFSMKTGWNFDFNWPLQGFISESAALAPQQINPIVLSRNPEPQNHYQLSASSKPLVNLYPQKVNDNHSPVLPVNNAILPGHTGHTPVPLTPGLTGYNVFRDNVKIADNIPDLFFDDLALAKGGYDFEVSAQYDLGESARTGPVHVDIYTCFPPTGLTVSNATLTTTSAILSWTPSLISTNPEWTLEWGPSGFLHGSGTTVTITTSPNYTLAGLVAGNEYDFYIRTVCTPSDFSVWEKKTFRTHYFNCPAGAIAETEACGDSTNNGCEMTPPLTGTISCGDTICGTSWLHRSHRDSDWYSFTLTEPNDVTLSGSAEFTRIFAIAQWPCTDSLFYTSATISPGYNVPITAQLGAGTHYIYVAPSYSGEVACDSLNKYWIKFVCSTCLTPTALTDTIITSTSATLGWTSNAGLWNIEWGLSGFTQGTGTMITGTPLNPYTLSGLTMGHTYSFYVQSDCGGDISSFWSAPHSFFLPCPATSLPYAEDFTSQALGTTPQCWQVLDAGSPSNWVVEDNSSAGGSPPQLSFIGYPYIYADTSCLTSPVINTSGQTLLNLSFKQYIYFNNINPRCEILTTSDGGNTWNSVWALSQVGSYGPETTYLSISTPDVGSATFQLAFAVYGYSWELGSWHIDDISLSGTAQTGTIQGVVTDCAGSSLLAGVSVTVGGQTGTTNGAGFYQISEIPVGTYNVEFSLAGYLTKTLTAVEVLNGSTTALDVCLDLAGPPATTTVQNITVLSGQSNCFNATQTITVAGSGTSFIVNSGGTANMIAGINIIYLPGTLVYAGGYLHGKIAPDGPFCGAKSASFVSSGKDEETPVITEKAGLKVYPNPTNGKFRIELTGNIQAEITRIDIFGLHGESVLSEAGSGAAVNEFSIADKPAGIYFVKVMAGKNLLTGKIVKTK